jgi:DNA-binding NarL/FixJ family response regulator
MATLSIAFVGKDEQLLHRITDYVEKQFEGSEIEKFASCDQLSCSDFDVVILERQQQLHEIQPEWPYCTKIFVVAERVSIPAANTLLQYGASGIISKRKKNFNVLLEGFEDVLKNKKTLLSLRDKLETLANSI